MENDTPKVWNNTAALVQNEYPQQEMVEVQEEKPLPSIEEQQRELEKSGITGINYNMVNTLIEMNKVAQLLQTVRATESEDGRRAVLRSFCEGFVHARMQNNIVAETLKAKLLARLLQNIDRLDLSTAAQIYIDLTQTMAVDTQMAMSAINGMNPSATTPISSGVTVNISNASGDAPTITNNTLNTDQGAAQLKEVSLLNNNVKAWSNNTIPTQASIKKIGNK